MTSIASLPLIAAALIDRNAIHRGPFFSFQLGPSKAGAGILAIGTRTIIRCSIVNCANCTDPDADAAIIIKMVCNKSSPFEGNARYGWMVERQMNSGNR